jgi:hypothetical protein
VSSLEWRTASSDASLLTTVNSSTEMTMTDDTRTIGEIFTQEVIDAAIEAYWRGTPPLRNWCRNPLGVV